MGTVFEWQCHVFAFMANSAFFLLFNIRTYLRYEYDKKQYFVTQNIASHNNGFADYINYKNTAGAPSKSEDVI